MDELLASAYGTAALVSGGFEKTAEAELLEELEKVAAAEGIDLNDLSDDEIVEILAEALNEDGETEKTANFNGMPITEDEFVSADYRGRVTAHAIINELSAIGDNMEKQASDEDVGQDDLVVQRANEILAAAAAAQEDWQEKQASGVSDEDLNAAALTLLDQNDYDVDLIVDLLS